jgi:uncharacterized membrane protein YbaN (DUF454 family)
VTDTLRWSTALPGAQGAVRERASRWQRPPLWLWAVSLVAQVLCAAVSTAYTFFFVDDFLFLEQARTLPFNLAYLRGPLFEHFSPISRLLDKLLVVAAPGSFGFAHAVELALYACALLAFAFVIREILGNTWTTFAFTIVFGQSIFLLRLLNWWTATANILPSTIFMLVALGCYLRWRARGSGWLLAASVAAYALALLDYEEAMLFPVYLALITFLVLEWRSGPRGWLTTLRRERWAWCGYILLAVLALANYYRYYYVSAAGRPSLHQLGSFLVIALFDTFVPALFGVKYPITPEAHVTVIAVASVVMAAAIAVTLYLRPRAWRCLLAFVVVFLVTMLPVGFNRIVQQGVGTGHVIYYQQSLQFMFLVLAAFAISPRWSGRRAASRSIAVPRALLAIGGTAAVAVYGILYVTSLRAMEHASWQPSQDRAYVNAYLASVGSLRRARAREPVLIDLPVPTLVMPRHLWPYTMASQFFALFDPALRAGGSAHPLYLVNRRGTLRPASFGAKTSAQTHRATVASRPGPWAPSPQRVPDGCVPMGRKGVWLRVPLAQRQYVPIQTGDAQEAIRVGYRLPTTTSVSVALIAGNGATISDANSEFWDGGSGTVLVSLASLSQPLSVKGGKLAAIAFRLPPGACVTGLSLGSVHSR